jgi:hypothetical protein
MRPTLAIIIATLLESVSAHFSFVDIKSQIACNFYAKDGTDWLSLPIMEGQPFSEWWMHGQVGCQSNATGSFALPANGRTHIVMSSRVQKVPPPYSTGSGYAPSNPDTFLQGRNGVADPNLLATLFVGITTSTPTLVMTQVVVRWPLHTRARQNMYFLKISLFSRSYMTVPSGRESPSTSPTCHHVPTATVSARGFGSQRLAGQRTST